jgi:DNA-binding NtrC family response regulator
MTDLQERARVLVVDDHVEMTATIVDGLLQHGYEGVGVSSGEAALRLLRTERIDALVTDLRMPELDGLTLLRTSVALDPLRPVIVMTAYGSMQTALDAVEGGSFQYLVKPFRIDLLARILRQALEGRPERSPGRTPP